MLAAAVEARGGGGHLRCVVAGLEGDHAGRDYQEACHNTNRGKRVNIIPPTLLLLGVLRT